MIDDTNNEAAEAQASKGAQLLALANKLESGAELTPDEQAKVDAARAEADAPLPKSKGVKISAAREVDQPKGQGGKPTSNKPLPKGAKAPKGKPVAAAPTVAVNKGKPKGMKAQRLERTDMIEGYDLDAWLATCPDIPVPTLEAIVAASCFNHGGKPVHTAVTKNVLSIAFYLMPEAAKFDVYKVATALQAACGGNDDHKMNAAQRVVRGGFVTLHKAQVAQAEGQRAKTSYHLQLTAKGRTQVLAALEARKLKAPKWALAPEGAAKPGKPGKGAPKPDKAGVVAAA